MRKRPCSSRQVLALLTLTCFLALAVGKSPVFLISIDGLRTDYLHMAKQLNLPTLSRLIDDGTLAAGAYSVFPSVTFPSHTSMITGVNPARHSIWNNNVFGPLDNNNNDHYFYQDITARTIFDAAKEQGLSMMGVDWPVSVGAPLDPIFPGNNDYPSTLDEAKWLYNTIKGPVQSVFPNASSLFGYISDDKRTAMGLNFLEYKKGDIDLFAFHFNDLDHYQHEYGYMSEAAIKTLRKIDGYLGQILGKIESQGLMRNGTVIIVSDHGFTNTSGTIISPLHLLSVLDIVGPGSKIPWQSWTDCSSGVCPIFIHPDADPQVYKRVDQAILTLQSNPDFGITRVFNKKEMEPLGCWPGAYAMLQLDLKYQFGGFHNPTGPLVECCGSKGQHGYNPNLPEMFASFLAYGPNIKAGQKIPMVHLIDVGPTIAHIMGLSLPNVEGKVLTELFK